MAYIEPKTDWNEEYEPSNQDMVRIEGNTKIIAEDPFTFRGLKQFANGLETDTINNVAGNGVVIEGVRIKNGVIFNLTWGV